MMNIDLAKKMSDNDNIVIMGRKGDPFGQFLRSKNERDWLKRIFREKTKPVSINQFNRWVFILPIEEGKKPVHEILEEIRKNARNLLSAINENKLEKVCLIDLTSNLSYLAASIEGIALGNYQFNKYFTKPDREVNSLKTLGINSTVLKQKQLDELNYVIKAVYKARDLVNEPLSHLTAVRLAEEIEKMGKETGFGVEVFYKKKIESLRMGGLLAVNKGSIDPPTFSILTWKPPKARNKKPVVLVGKGIVFDTGGLSLKPTFESMDYMKCDMAGAAAVAGTFYALAALKVPVYTIGLIPSTDNRPDGNAYAPGDVIKMFDGSTVEVLNTDAEGRMILADALAWAKRYKPELVITVATLTGAAQAAIGNNGIVAMGNPDRKVFEKLKHSGDMVYERLAEFPFWNDYNDALKSDIADLKNIGGRYAGAITGGKFLEHFTDYPFIHLDIAGPAFNKTADSYRGKGGSGTGIRLLYDFLKNWQ
jgi:leucyl aminopeptidase